MQSTETGNGGIGEEDVLLPNRVWWLYRGGEAYCYLAGML